MTRTLDEPLLPQRPIGGPGSGKVRFAWARWWRRRRSDREPGEPHERPRTAVDAGSADGLAAAQRIVVTVGGKDVLVLRIRDRYYAVSNRCPHLGHRLDDATVGRNDLRCAGHGYRFDLRTGACRDPHGARAALTRYDTWVVDGRVFVAARA